MRQTEAEDRTAKRWKLPVSVKSHTLPGNLPGAVAQVLLGRGIDSDEKLRLFLDPPHRLPYDPLRLAGMDRAVQRLYRAIQRKEKVGVFGDFDVDGLTGTAIIAQGLRQFDLEVVPYLPHRVAEGHGLTGAAVRNLVGQGVGLIITVDCGISSVTEIAEARQLGAEAIITDHHVPHASLPQAVAIINPRLSEDSYPFVDLCGAGLAFKLVQGLYQFYGQPWDPSLLELAALGTVADLVPLVDENRFLVQQGLAELARTKRPGLLALYRRAGIQPDSLNAETLSFQLAPRLNAAGRMSHAMDGYRLLTTDSTAEAEALAEKLEGLNRDRRDLTEEAFANAWDQVHRLPELPPILLVAGEWLTPGVAGLVAGRLVETLHRPAVAMAVDGDYVIASGRSIPEFNIVKAFSACQDLFLRYGGHAQAAGFTLARHQVPLLESKLTAIAGELLEGQDLRPSLAIDAEVRLADLTGEAVRWLSLLAPFGPANPPPVFLTRQAQVVETRQMGRTGQHLRLRVREGKREWWAVAFHQADRWTDRLTCIDMAYSITSDRWQGAETLALKVLDFRPA